MSLVHLYHQCQEAKNIEMFSVLYCLNRDEIRIRLESELPEEIDIIVKIRGFNRRITVYVDGKKVPYNSLQIHEQWFKQQGWLEKMQSHLQRTISTVANKASEIVRLTKR
jgi:hypothetical protein